MRQLAASFHLFMSSVRKEKTKQGHNTEKRKPTRTPSNPRQASKGSDEKRKEKRQQPKKTVVLFSHSSNVSRACQHQRQELWKLRPGHWARRGRGRSGGLRPMKTPRLVPESKYTQPLRAENTGASQKSKGHNKSTKTGKKDGKEKTKRREPRRITKTKRRGK